MAAITLEEDAALRKKWFGTPLDLGSYGRYIIWGLIAAGGIGLLLFVWNMTLRRQVASKTQTLNATLNELRQAHAAASEAEQKPSLPPCRRSSTCLRVRHRRALRQRVQQPGTSCWRPRAATSSACTSLTVLPASEACKTVVEAIQAAAANGQGLRSHHPALTWVAATTGSSGFAARKAPKAASRGC